MKATIEIGKSYTVQCPFIRERYSSCDEDGWGNELSWRPGVVWEPLGPEDAEPVAHGVGSVTYTVVDVHKLPRPFPTRVFFTRKFTSPDGRAFGKGKLHIMTSEAFGRRISGWYANGADGFSVRDLAPEEIKTLLKSAA